MIKLTSKPIIAEVVWPATRRQNTYSICCHRSSGFIFYRLITTHLLPASLVLLLLPVDLKAILRLGPTALAMFFIGSFGIIVGTVISFSLFKPLIGPRFWA